MWRDAAFVAFTVGAAALSYLGGGDSIARTTLIVLAATTATAIHARLVRSRGPALMHTAFGVVALLAIGAEARLAGTVVVSSLLASELVANQSTRQPVLRAGAWAGASGAAVLFLWTVMLGSPRPAATVALEVLAAAAGGFLGAPLALALGPVVEWLFRHTSRLTMGEWLSFDQPLLRDLASKAPGTFQHSVSVGVLVGAAARAIDADAFLARLGGLYHDVGKMRAPEYFFENQHGANAHDGLDPWDSARILRAHVSDGVDLVREHRMGLRMEAFVLEHHGTDLMRLLQEKARGNPDEGPTDEAYRYAGPRPQSRETALLMIADQLEATARSAPPEDGAACDAVVRRTVARIWEAGELETSGLQPSDFTRVESAFSAVLQAMYHRRVSYPPSRSEPQPKPAPESTFAPALALVRRSLGRPKSRR